MLFGVDDSLTGGGIVGGIVTTIGALYLIWEKVSRRKSERRKEKIANDKEQLANDKEEIAVEERRINLDGAARKAVAEAYKDALDRRKTTHDEDIKTIRKEIASNTKRLNALETSEKQCQANLAALKEENVRQTLEIAGLKEQNSEQSVELTSLRKEVVGMRTKIETLEAKIKSQ